MNDGTEDLSPTLEDEISDEAVEAAAFVTLGGRPPTLVHGSYCFTCRPAISGQVAYQGRGAKDCGQRGEVAGAVAEGLTGFQRA